jgi:hypothetical protein
MCPGRQPDRSRRFPDNVFRRRLPLEDAFDFFSIFAAGFYERLQGHTRLAGGARAYLLVIDPDPVAYFYRHFSKYPIMVIETTTDSAGDYYRGLNQDPGNSIAAAINTNANVLAIVFDTIDVAVYGERDSELAICTAPGLQAGAVNPMRLLEGMAQFDDKARTELLVNYRASLEWDQFERRK